MTPPKCKSLRDRCMVFEIPEGVAMSSSEIAGVIGGRGVTPKRVFGFMKTRNDVIYEDAKRIKTGPNAGRCVGAGKWRRKE